MKDIGLKAVSKKRCCVKFLMLYYGSYLKFLQAKLSHISEVPSYEILIQIVSSYTK